MIGSFFKKTLVMTLLTIIFGLAFAALGLTEDVVLDEDAEISVEGPFFTDNILYLPALSIAGVDQLFSSQMLLKQEGDEVYLELVQLTPSETQDALEATATLSSEGTLNIPLLNFEEQSFWQVNLQWKKGLAPPTSPLPIKFDITDLTEETLDDLVDPHPEDEGLLGMKECKWISQGRLGYVRYCCDRRGCWIDEYRRYAR